MSVLTKCHQAGVTLPYSYFCLEVLRCNATRRFTGRLSTAMKPAILLLTLFAMPAVAASSAVVIFDERVALAKAAAEDERFHPYPEQMVREASGHIARTMRKCRPLSRQDPKPFVLVAEIDPDGVARDVMVRPAHAAARCFASGFTSSRYLPPPDYPDRGSFPVMVRIGGR